MLSNELKKVRDNFFSLSTLQIVNYALPLVTLPYLVRVLGVELFGLLAFATSVVAYFGLVIEYGFNLSATKQVSLNSGNLGELNRIFSSVISIKLFLLLISFIVFTFGVFHIDKLNQNSQIYILTFLMLFGQVLFPVWLYQGLQEMKVITIINIVSKTIFVICIFVFVNSKDHVWLVPAFYSAGFIVAGVTAYIMAVRKYGISFRFQPINRLGWYLRDSSAFFISNVSGSIYTTSVIVILGIFSNNTTVGYYAAADKIIQAFKGLLMPVTQAIYPYVNKKVNDSPEEAVLFIKRIIWSLGLSFAFLSLVIFIGADLIIITVLGGDFHPSIVILKTLAPLPFLVALGNSFGVLTLIPFGFNVAFTRSIIFGALISLVLSFLLVPSLLAYGSALTLIITELAIATVMFVYIYRNHILQSNI